MVPLLLLASIAYALDRPDVHPPSCDQGAVQRCNEEHRIAGDGTRATIATIDARLQAIGADRARVQSDLDGAKASLAAKDVELAALATEISFAGVPESTSSTEIFPNFPSAEDFFGLHPLELMWRARYSGDYAEILSKRLEEAKTERAGLAARLGAIAPEFEHLDSEYRSLTSSRANLVTEESQHVYMCNGGCRNQVCPYR